MPITKEPREIVLIEDRPQYVFNAFEQLGEKYRLRVLCTIAEAHKYFMQVAEGAEKRPDIILADCHLPEKPVSNDVEWIRKLIGARDAEAREAIHERMHLQLALANKELKGITNRIELLGAQSPEFSELKKREEEMFRQMHFAAASTPACIENLRKSGCDTKAVEEEIYDLQKQVYKEVPVGMLLVMKAAMMGVPFIGMLKGSGHGMPPMTWHAEVLFDPKACVERNVTTEGESDFIRSKNEHFVNSFVLGNSKISMAFNQFSKTHPFPSKNWNLLLEELLK